MRTILDEYNVSCFIFDIKMPVKRCEDAAEIPWLDCRGGLIFAGSFSAIRGCSKIMLFLRAQQRLTLVAYCVE